MVVAGLMGYGITEAVPETAQEPCGPGSSIHAGLHDSVHAEWHGNKGGLDTHVRNADKIETGHNAQAIKTKPY